MSRQGSVSLAVARRPRQCFLQVSTNILQQVETFKYLVMIFTSDKVGTKRLIHGLVKQTQFCVSFFAPWWRNRGFQTRQTFQFLNLSLFRSSLVVMNLRWRINGRDWILLRVLGVTLRDRGHRSEICKASISSHFPQWLDPSYVNSAMCPNCPRKEWRTMSFRLSLHPRESGPKFVQGPGGVTTSPTLLGPFLVWSQQNYLRFLLIARYFESS